MAVTATPSADRPFYKRWTIIAGAIIVLVEYGEAQHLIPMGFASEMSALLESGATMLGLAGLYRHIPTT